MFACNKVFFWVVLQLNITITGDMGANAFGARGTAYRCMYGSPNVTTLASGASGQSLTCAPPGLTALSQFPGLYFSVFGLLPL